MTLLNRFTGRIPSLLLLLIVVLAAMTAGWWLGQQHSNSGVRKSNDPSQLVLSKETDRLRLRLAQGQATDSDKQRFLELLIALDRRDEAIQFLEMISDQQPNRLSLRLILAELRRDQDDRPGAERELRQILSRQSDHVEALELLAMLKLEQGRGFEAQAQVKAIYAEALKPSPQPKALKLGLLLAEIESNLGKFEHAKATYDELAEHFPKDQRPLLGLALLLHDRKLLSAAQEALDQARLRSDPPGQPDPRLDQLAAAWGLESLKSPFASGQNLPAKAPVLAVERQRP